MTLGDLTPSLVRYVKRFHVCSTVEKDYLEKFKEIGYDNIIHGMWHTNLRFLPHGSVRKTSMYRFVEFQISRERVSQMPLKDQEYACGV